MQTAKAQASLRIQAVSPEPSLFAHKIYESRASFGQKAVDLHTCDISRGGGGGGVERKILWYFSPTSSLMPWDANLMVFEKDKFLEIFGSFMA